MDNLFAWSEAPSSFRTAFCLMKFFGMLNWFWKYDFQWLYVFVVQISWLIVLNAFDLYHVSHIFFSQIFTCVFTLEIPLQWFVGEFILFYFKITKDLF